MRRQLKSLLPYPLEIRRCKKSEIESGVDRVQIKVLLGHSSSKTTEIHTHVATTTFQKIKNPLDF
jgi:integrase